MVSKISVPGTTFATALAEFTQGRIIPNCLLASPATLPNSNETEGLLIEDFPKATCENIRLEESKNVKIIIFFIVVCLC